VIIRTIRKSHPQSVLFSFVVTCVLLRRFIVIVHDVKEVRIGDKRYVTVVERMSVHFVITALEFVFVILGLKIAGRLSRWSFFFINRYSSSDISFVILWIILSQGTIKMQWIYAFSGNTYHNIPWRSDLWINFYTRLWHLVAEDELLCVKRISRLKFLLLIIRFNNFPFAFPPFRHQILIFPVVKLKFGKSRKILWNQKIFKSGRRSM